MLSKLRSLLSIAGPRRLPLHGFSTAPKDQLLLKVCTILRTNYLPINEEIPKGTTVRLIDDATGNFIGLQPIESAV